jgi:hypothetical protein
VSAYLARHPQWTPDQQKHELAVLFLKWQNGNSDTVERTVREMDLFGSRIYSYELVDDDYRDMFRAKSKEWQIEDEIKPLNQELERLRGDEVRQ